jgi:Skp family chaperone for outer membrane proteins
MAASSAKTASGSVRRRQALHACADALRHVADYQLPPALARKLSRMLSDKEELTTRERKDLLALVEVAQENALEKVKARVALDLLTASFPQLGG